MLNRKWMWMCSVGLALTGVSAFADSAKYDCGRSFGSKIELVIKNSRFGDRYDHEGYLVGPGVDPVTGSLVRSMKTDLVGSIDLHPEDGDPADKIRIFAMHNVKNPNHQVIAEIGPKGARVDVAVIMLGSGDGEFKRYECKVLSYKKSKPKAPRR